MRACRRCGAAEPAPLALWQQEAALDYKHCQILKTEAGLYLLSGAKRSCGSIRELLHCYRREALRTDGYTFQLSRGCPPSLKGQRLQTAICGLGPPAPGASQPGRSVSSDKSNLLVCRSSQGAEVPLALHTHNISQMVFHKIRREDLVLVGEPSRRGPAGGTAL